MKINQLKVGAILSYIAIGIGTIVAFVYTPFMLRTLGTSEFGLYSLVNSVIAYLTILDFGFGNAIIRYTAKYRAEKNIEQQSKMLGMFWLLYIGIGVVAFIFVAILTLNINGFFPKLTPQELDIVKVLMWLAGINLAMTFPFSIFTSIITAYEKFVFVRVINILRLVMNPTLMVIVLLIGQRAIGMIAVATVANLIFNIVNMIYCRRFLKVKVKFAGVDKPLLKEITKYSFFVFLNIIVDRIYWSTGQVLLGSFAGAVSTGIYAIGVLFVNQFYMPMSTAISGLFLPKITAISLEHENEKKLSELFSRVGRIQMVLIGLMMSGFAIYGLQFIQLWAGPIYVEAYYVGLILMLPLTVPLIQNIGISILQAKNLHAFRSVSFLIIAVANIFVSIFFIKIFGTIGAASGTALSLILGQIIIMNIYYKRKIKLDILKFWIEIAKLLPAIAIACVFGVVFKYFFPVNSFFMLFANAIIFSIVYFALMYFIGINTSEKELFITPVLNIFKKIRKRLGRKNDPQ